ncbi:MULTISPECIES: CsgG/HfaB family protein [unclassified Campylobacter]|uniref:CsgG/HfaB family protein n=1 Tax=unclassified Campylobacter TaxID=2593542 RepID=UPI001BDA9028|nr:MULTISPECIES: CsgG/HfaB family protein [unclassified Campylobacter]MBT0880774.1 hypothetical protein [Campylobacter sp. 2018MI27]MBT0885567.1 hypothetical protein [Campylobacter sp. 2018MI10]
MKKILIIFLGLFLVSLNAKVVTTTSTKTATGEGYGITYSEAVDNALAQAVTKLNGAYIKASNSFSQTQLESSADGTNINALFNQKISKATNGRFSSFEVIENTKTEDGFRVVVSIQKTAVSKKYELAGMKNDRRKIIVAPALSPNNFSLLGRDSEQITRDLRFKIESNIHKTRKFDLLDRQEGEALAVERDIILNDANKDEALKLGQNLGTDYILLYTISDVNTTNKNYSIIGSGSSSKVSVSINYQVITFATRQIRFADSINLDIKSKDYDSILNNIASTIVLNTQAAIYPPKIEKISNNQAVFTQSLPINTQLECYKKGDKIYDSYTKELNGYEEIFSALVQVTNANAKTSYAKILEGNANKGDICRFKNIGNNSTSNDANGKDVKDITPVQGGGFIF